MRTDAIYSHAIAIPIRAFSRICLIFTILLFPKTHFSQTNPCDEVPITIIVDHFGRTELPSILCKEQVYYSVTGLFDFLQVKNEPSPDFTSVEGFLQHQEDTFSINASSNQITYKNKVSQLDSADLIRTRTGLFLRADNFSKIFGLENQFSSRNLAATLVPAFELPAVKAAKRKQMRENLRRVQGEFLADTVLKRDRPVVHFGSAQWNVNTTQSTDGLSYNRLGVGIGGLLAGGEFLGNINYNSGMDFTSQNLFYQWRHVNNENELFRQFTVGKIVSQAVSSIFHPVVGVQVTNAPTFAERSFGTYTISDHTQPDWMVELYINNMLVDYTQADASGFFSFDVPLTYGNTEVSLRYYGPWGEVEVSNKHFNVPFNFLSPGKFQYTLSSGVVEDQTNSKFFQGRAQYGLTERITVGAGIEYLSSLEENAVIPFVNSAFRLPANILISGEYMHEVGYKGNFSFTSPSSLRLDLSYKSFEEEQEAVRFSYLEERQASLTFPLQVGKFSGTSRLTFQQNVLQTNTYTHLEWLVSANAWGLRANLTNTAFINQYSDPLVYSRLSTAIRLPGKFVFSPKVEYEYLRDGLTSFEGELRKRFFKNVNFQTSYTRNFRFDQYYINLGVTFDLGFTRVGLNSSTNKRNSSFSQSAGGSIMFEPHDYSWAFEHRPMMGRGSLKFEPFLDENGNGLKDQNEKAVEGVNVHILGGGMRERTPEGITIFKGLEPYTSYYFTLDTRNLKNIAWQVEHKSMEVFVNPNQMKVIQIPVKVLGEVAGFVHLGADGIGGIKINIFDSKGELVENVLSESDGYFSYMGLPSGEYTASVDQAQLGKLNLAVKGDFPFGINNTREGDYVDNLEFFLTETDEIQIPGEKSGVEGPRDSQNGEDPLEEGEDLPAEETSENLQGETQYNKEHSGLVYKVQFLSSKDRIDVGGPQLKGLPHVSIEKTPTAYRYLWGSTTLAEEAYRLQQELRGIGFKDAYVVHYYNGERISVDKAVEIRSKLSEPEKYSPVVVSEEVLNKDVSTDNQKTGLNFKVQIAASKVQIDPSDARFMGLEGVKEYRHDGLFKYVLGNFRFFSEANQYKNVLRGQGLEEAFVVPFQDKERMDRGQVRGYIYFRDSSKKGIGGISLQIRDTAGKLVSTTLSEADGSFVSPVLQPGRYMLKLDREELAKIGMRTDNPEVFIRIDKEGHMENSAIDFILTPDSQLPEQSPEETQDGLVFKVQVLASVPKLSVDHRLLNGLENVERYRHQGLYKYTVGESKKLKEIRKTREGLLLEGFKDAFIVAFLNGRRINLQEMTGQVFLEAGGKKQALEGISIGIYTYTGNQITRLVSGENGKFHFLGLKPGAYIARLDNKQLKDLGIKTDNPVVHFEIQRNTEGEIRNPVIFYLEKDHFQPDEIPGKMIEYRIQLAASNVPLGPNHPTLRGMQNVSMYRHNGMYKYTVGSTYHLWEARELMKKIEASHEFTLFIVGFKEGERVIVIE